MKTKEYNVGHLKYYPALSNRKYDNDVLFKEFEYSFLQRYFFNTSGTEHC